MMKRPWILSGAIAMTIASILFAKPGTVTTRDGQKYEGDITEKTDDVVINIRGVETVITRDNIERIAYSEAFEVEFADRMTKLEAEDVAGRIALARWAFESRRYDKAREALESALAIDPNNKEAHDTLALVRSQVRMEQKQTDAPAPAVRPERPANATPGGLTADEVNDIRQKELRIGDGVSIRFENDVRKRFAEQSRKNVTEVTRMRAAEAAILILNEGEPGMAADVRISNDPSGMLEYRRTIQPVILNTCATANCHGTAGAGNFRLISPAGNDGDAYANFLKLATTGKKVGGGDSASNFFGGSQERMMIERGHGERSLLANYMLPASGAELPHPPVQGFDGSVRSTSDPKYRAVVKWMNEALRLPAPDYGRTSVVGAEPATQPATGPATRPVE